MSTQAALLSLKSKLDTVPSGLDPPFQRNPSSVSIRSMSPSDAILTSQTTDSSPPKSLSGGTSSIGNTVAPGLNINDPVGSPSVSVSAFPLPADKKEEILSDRERGSFDHTRGNWGHRIVLTTYPGQSNVGTTVTYHSRADDRSVSI